MVALTATVKENKQNPNPNSPATSLRSSISKYGKVTCCHYSGIHAYPSIILPIHVHMNSSIFPLLGVSVLSDTVEHQKPLFCLHLQSDELRHEADEAFLERQLTGELQTLQLCSRHKLQSHKPPCYVLSFQSKSREARVKLR